MSKLKKKPIIKRMDKHESNDHIAEFYSKCNEKIKLLGSDKKAIEKELFSTFEFKTKNSSDIKYNLLREAINTIDRNIAKKELLKYIEYENIVHEIEKGLFEFSLIHVTINKLEYHFVSNIYYDQLYNLCMNLDTDNEKINNNTLKPNIINKVFNPYFIAFLPPEVLHPKKWANIIIKNQKRNDIANNIQTSNIYKCSKCGERKFRITQMQMRCADEPTSTICTCMVCYFTFIKG